MTPDVKGKLKIVMTIKKAKKKHLSPSLRRASCPFLCKFRCSANESAAQAGRGPLQAIGHFTICKVLKECAARLHGGAQGGRGGEIGEVPGFIGRKL